MSFDYEQLIWGKGIAKTIPSDPTSIRFRYLLNYVKNLKNGDRVLEIGCGAGQFIRGLKVNRPELECYGSDISQEAIKEGLAAKDGVKYFQQSDRKLPFEDNFFDAVFILDVLEHTEYWKEILDETKRVLRNNGKLYLFVPCEGENISLWNILRKIGVAKDLTKKFAGHINYFKSKQIIGELNKIGFDNDVRYSEHLFGQILGVGVFLAMDLSSKKDKSNQINNEKFFASNSENAVIRFVKKAVNSLVFAESVVLQRVPSPNLHVFSIISKK
jgi:SAM-dependent methyltransferase